MIFKWIVPSRILTLIHTDRFYDSFQTPFAGGDFDGDALTDLSVPAPWPGPEIRMAVRILERRKDFSWPAVFEWPILAIDQGAAAAGDIDGDGQDELVVGGVGTCWGFELFDSCGNGCYEQVWQETFYTGRGHGYADFGDTDGDGHDELAVSIGNAIHLYEWQGGWDLKRIFELQLCPECWDARVFLEDLDGDAQAELVVPRASHASTAQDPECVTIYKRGNR
jgi:hypothetical protein